MRGQFRRRGLMHRVHLLEFEGKSYRLKEAASRLTGLVKHTE